MKKITSVILSVMMFLAFMAVPNVTAYAANVGMSVSASNVNIGDSITVTVTVPEGVTASIDVSYPSDLVKFSSTGSGITASDSGNAVSFNMGQYAPNSPMSATITFSAKSAGTATFSATSIKAGDSTGEEIELGGASASVMIANQAATTPSTSSTPSTPSAPTVSDNNQLGWMTISPGTLSPGFHPDTTNYKVTVGHDVTKLSISALAAHDKATVTSVSGANDLKVGENKVSIVVKAENGVTKTYTIMVTRKEQAQEPESDSSENSTEQAPVENTLSWNGSKLEPVDKIPESVIPTDFKASTMMMNNKEVPVLEFKNGQLTVMYLSDESGDNNLYIYDERVQDVYPFVSLGDKENYVVVLRPDDASAPAGYLSCTLSIEGKGLVNAYQFNVEELLDNTDESAKGLFGTETYYAAEPTASDFYLIYCMNKAGESGWYQYDSVEGTFQRYAAGLFASAAVPDKDSGSEDNAETLPEVETLKQQLLIVIIVAAVVVVILLIIVIVLAVKLSRKDDEYYDEEDDEYDEEDDVYIYDDDADYEEVEYVETDVEDDEVEIEFYEMEPEIPDMEELLVKEVMEEQPVSQKVKPVEQPKRVVTPIDVDDDDSDLEFIDLD